MEKIKKFLKKHESEIVIAACSVVVSSIVVGKYYNAKYVRIDVLNNKLADAFYETQGIFYNLDGTYDVLQYQKG